MKKVAIIDFELGNLFSVRQACLSQGVDAFFTNKYKDLESADMLILPGVGAFGQAMANLKKFELDKAIKEIVNNGKPLMGICLGLQLLFEGSNEFGSHEGLGLVSGHVRRIPEVSPTNEKLLIPQIAWNRVYTKNQQVWDKSPLKSLNDGDYMYFVHSYYVAPQNNSDELSFTNYDGFNYCSSVFKKNIFATQFHPEKSGPKGIEIYRNWLFN